MYVSGGASPVTVVYYSTAAVIKQWGVRYCEQTIHGVRYCELAPIVFTVFTVPCSQYLTLFTVPDPF